MESFEHQISQRDLRLRSREIMDAVEQGQTFVVTRGGQPIGELSPLRAGQTFVPRDDFARLSEATPLVDLARFRADQDAGTAQLADDPYER